MRTNRKHLIASLTVFVSMLLVSVTIAKDVHVKTPSTNSNAKPAQVGKHRALQLSPSIDAARDPRTEGIEAAAGAAVYQINWQSINGGGGPATSAGFQVNGSVGQSVIGYSNSPSYQAGAGYWYGASGGGGGCNCPNQGDVAPLAGPGDGAVDVLDVVALIDEVFRSGPTTTTDGTCPQPRGDLAPVVAGVQCGDGAKDVLDVVFEIDFVFRSGPAPCDPCNP